MIPIYKINKYAKWQSAFSIVIIPNDLLELLELLGVLVDEATC